MGRLAFMALALLIAAGAARADEPAGGSVAGRELALTFATQNLGGSTQALTGSTQGLVFTVIDMGGKPTDVGGKPKDLEIKETKTEIHIELAADVLFDFDKYDIRPKAQEALKAAAEIIRANAKGTVRIEGHTDAKGNDAHNQRLSEQRANSVKTWLTAKEGLKSVKFTTQGFGAKRPVAPNAKPNGSDDPDGRQKNRRVEIVISKG
jgi:outer membrane protein OmpA-like peptidoglycan-associated protein